MILTEWTRGWEKVLERHVLRSVRASPAQAPALKTLVTDACFYQQKSVPSGTQTGHQYWF